MRFYTHPLLWLRLTRRVQLAAPLLLLLLTTAVHAQQLANPALEGLEGGASGAPRAVMLAPVCESTINGFPPILPSVPQKPPHAPGEVASFVESLGTNDAAFEVVVGQGRMLTLKEDLAVPGKRQPLIAVGDPSIVEFTVVGRRQLRLSGLRLGTTDLSITTADDHVFGFEVHVVADLRILRCQLKAMFPDASLKLAQLQDHVVVEGEARDAIQVARILETIKAYLVSLQASEARKITGQNVAPTAGQPRRGLQPVPPVGAEGGPAGPPDGREARPGETGPILEQGQISVDGTVVAPQIINLIRVPGSHQVLLKVRVAELNRSALRQIGADVLAVDRESGAIVGTQVGGAAISAAALFNNSGITGTASGSTAANTTVFGIFQQGSFEFLLQALARKSVLKVLAEPNLVAMSGQPASFLAGGEFPVPIPQSGGLGGGAVVTVAFKEFGVRLGFVPYVLDDGLIRLTVDPEVSTIDFTIGAVLVPGGTPVPGLNTRKSHTTVEMHQGQTLAIAGLLQLTMDGTTSRIPGLGDLPCIGPFFRNTSNTRTEKELVVLVTPYLVEPMNPCQVPPSPGEEVKEPTDYETYFLARTEGRSGKNYRSTTEGSDPLHLRQLLKLEKEHVRGPCGFSD